MREVVERLLNVFDSFPIVVNRVEADVPITSLHPPHIHHEATFENLCGALTIYLHNPFSFLLLMICNELFSLVFTGSKVRRILGRMSSFLTCPHTLAGGRKRSGNCNNCAGRTNRLRNKMGLTGRQRA